MTKSSPLSYFDSATKEQNSLRLAVLVFCSSIFVVLVFWTLLPADLGINENLDFAAYYDPVARNLASGNGLLDKDGQFGVFYPPGFPAILAVLYKLSSLLGITESTMLSLFTLLCLGTISTAIFKISNAVHTATAALITAFAWMTYPFLLWLTKQPNSEIPFLAILYSGYGLVLISLFKKDHRWHRYFLAGILIGCAMLVRPAAIGTWLVIIITIWIGMAGATMRLRLVLSVFFLMGVLVLVVPWEITSYVKTGKVVLLGDNGAIAMRGGLVFAVADKPYRQPISVPDDVRHLMHDIMDHYETLSSPTHVVTFMVEKFFAHPAAVAKLILIKIMRSWYGTDSQRYEKLIVLLQLPYLIVIALGGYFGWRKSGFQRTLIFSVLLMTVYFWLMSVLVTSTLRYMVPAIGLMFTFIPFLWSSKRPVLPHTDPESA
ncbi:MAG: glycosyltransferase family 39 protein [Chloracidobacterium sp.]|nr:glycosyltransferase family 39 protein [Chloracidobacterium sp.]